MKAYEDLTPRGKFGRIRQIAREALEAFRFTEAHLRFIVDAGNILYRVKDVDPVPMEGSLYVKDCYLLRLRILRLSALSNHF